MSNQDENGYYAVAICNLLEADNQIFWTMADTPQEAIALAVMLYAKENDHPIDDYMDWVAQLSADASIEDTINHFRQGDLIVSTPTKIQVYEP